MKIYPYYLKVHDFPDYQRRCVRVPSWETFGGTTQFTCLRLFSQEGRILLDYKRELDLYVDRFGLGRVIWPFVFLYQAENLPDLVAEIKRRGLYLFDIWGYEPMRDPVVNQSGHAVPTKQILDLFERELGDHYLGIDNGEQDGAYYGIYAPQVCPVIFDHREQYLNFHRHFRRMTDEFGNRITALVSLTAGHYFLKDGNTMLVGAEAAQVLPNSQVYYSFLRGAGKQYGVNWFGNASVYGYGGFKSYEFSGDDDVRLQGYSASPEAGTSLALLKRILWTHIMYNSPLVGFENGWLIGDCFEKRWVGLSDKPPKASKIPDSVRLSPIGRIQADAQTIMDKRLRMGTHITPLAIMLDFYSGWTMPRHAYCYTNQAYQTWGNIPYREGDYLTHQIFNLVYPGYADSAYYTDERGYLCPTPFGDILDTLLSDAPDWVLGRYDTVVVAGEIRHNCAEVADTVLRFARAGGNVILTAGNAVRFGDALTGIRVLPSATRVEARTVVRFGGDRIIEPRAFLFHGCENIGDGDVLADCEGEAVVVRVPQGKGSVITILSPFGVCADRLVRGSVPASTDRARNTPLPEVFLLTEHARRAFIGQFARLSPFSVGADLGYVACRKEKGDYEVLITNSSLVPKPFEIGCNVGRIEDIHEISLGADVSKERGYKPGRHLDAAIGEDTDSQIAGLSVRLFEVAVKDETADHISYILPPGPPRKRGIALSGKCGICESILMRPTFLQHFDTVKVPWTYFRDRDIEALRSEGEWLGRQKVEVLCDFSPGCNYYPDLSLLDNCPGQWDRSLGIILGVINKMAVSGAHEAIITLHRYLPIPDEKRVREIFLEDVRILCDEAALQGINLHMSLRKHRFIEGYQAALDFIRDANRPNLHFALDLCHVLLSREDIFEALRAAGDACRIVLLSAPHRDDFDQLYDSHWPCSSSPWRDKMKDIVGCAQDRMLVLNAAYKDKDEEYNDLYVFERDRKHSETE